MCLAKTNIKMGKCSGCCCKDPTGANRNGYLEFTATMIDNLGESVRAQQCTKDNMEHINCIEDGCEAFFLTLEWLATCTMKTILMVQAVNGQGPYVRGSGVESQMKHCDRCIDADPVKFPSSVCHDDIVRPSSGSGMTKGATNNAGCSAQSKKKIFLAGFHAAMNKKNASRL